MNLEQQQALEQEISVTANSVREFFKNYIKPDNELNCIISYALLAPGKMLRAHLTMSFAELAQLDKQSALKVAAAIEAIHCYSLIHDDLPALDDDDYRRGQLTIHKKYDEASAILVGDALQSLAFQLLSEINNAAPENLLNLFKEFSAAIGYQGMVLGQYIDITNQQQNLEEISMMQSLKTGKLIEISCLAPFILVADQPQIQDLVKDYAVKLGIAYQIKDDLLDLADSKLLGKTAGKDQLQEKKNLVTLLGKQQAQSELDKLLTEILIALDKLAAPQQLVNFTKLLLTRDK